MKKRLLFLATCFAMVSAQSQNVADALRYSQENLNGSARFRAMSGAFGAVGGDLSAINQNPAGSAVFNRSQVGITMSNYNTGNDSRYFGTRTSESNTTFDLNQAGGVFVFNTNSTKTGWKKFSLSVNYDNTNNYDDVNYFAGTNPTNSVANYFLSYANQLGLTANDYNSYYFEDLNLRERQAFLGYSAYVIDPAVDGNSSVFVSNVPSGGNYFQDYYMESQGYNGKLSFNAAASYNDRLYFGINLNTYFNDYTIHSSFYEENSNTPNADGPSVRSITYDNSTHTFGNGFSLQLGAIAKITNALRAGLAYESPTWYELNDEVLQRVYTDGSNYGNGSNTAASDSNISILYEPYHLRTPGKFTGSLAYVFGKSGLISVDYAIKDYSKNKFRPNDNYFQPVNSSISNELDMAAELRIGAEYRIKNWSLRGGFRYEESPYKNATTIGDLTSISGGFGYQFARTRLDLSYTYMQRDSQRSVFAQGFTDPVQNKAVNNNLSLGLVFDL